MSYSPKTVKRSTRTCTRTSSSLHEHVSSQMNRILMAEDDLPVWVTQGRTVLYQVGKSNTADNYRTITCFPLMWKLLTGVIAEEIYNYLDKKKSFQNNKKDAKEEVVEQKICY